jgi:hypothetical protein
VLFFTLLSLCPSDKKNGQTSPNAGHEGVWGSGCIAPDVHNFGTRWKREVRPVFFGTGGTWGGGYFAQRRMVIPYPGFWRPLGCPKTSLRSYRPTLREIPKECRSYLHRGRSLKSRTELLAFGFRRFYPQGKGSQYSLNKRLSRPLSQCLHDVIMRMSRNSTVGIATFYSVDGAGFELRWGGDFPHPFRPALGPT